MTSAPVRRVYISVCTCTFLDTLTLDGVLSMSLLLSSKKNHVTWRLRQGNSLDSKSRHVIRFKNKVTNFSSHKRWAEYPMTLPIREPNRDLVISLHKNGDSADY